MVTLLYIYIEVQRRLGDVDLAFARARQVVCEIRKAGIVPHNHNAVETDILFGKNVNDSSDTGVIQPFIALQKFDRV